MSSLYDQLTENFLRWTERGSGRPTFPAPVHPTPPFVAFPGHRLPVTKPRDDGVRHNFFSRLTQRAKHALAPPPSVKEPEVPEEPEPHWFGEEAADLVELTLLLPHDFTASPEAMTHFLSSVSQVSCPLTLELAGTAGRSSLSLCVQIEDVRATVEQLTAHFPEIICTPALAGLRAVWGDPDDGDERAVVEFSLAYPFMMPLAVLGKADPFVGLAGAMTALRDEEAAVYQVTFEPLSDPWHREGLVSVIRNDGRPYFDDGAELVKGAKEKGSRPLYSVVVRLAARAPELNRVWEIIRHMAAPLRLFSRDGGNQLTPVPNGEYDHWEHCEDLLHRRCRRSGMILNVDELCGFIRFPTAAVRTSGLLRLDGGTRMAAQVPETHDGVCLGLNEYAGRAGEVWLTTEQRVRHMHIIGASGSGKTNLLFNLLRQDILSGAGFALLDPHGDLVDKVLGIIPPERIEDVVLLDPSDEQFVVPFNFLSAHTHFEKTLLASDLVAVFRAQSTSWGDQMNSVFANAIRAFLESSEGGTLADLRRFLLDPAWREKFLATVTDPELVYYWKRGFPQLGGNKSIGPILTRLETFLSPKPIRYMVSQRENRLNFTEIMDGGKILLARLPQGQMGKENAHLLGGLLVAKLQQMAMSRQRMEAGSRCPFFVYADEFQNFICPSMAEVLTTARKYRMGFILAHQDLRQLERDKEVGAAVLSNAFTRVAFRVGDADARTLAEGFAHFEPRSLQNLPIGKALCRIERADNDFNLAVPLLDESDDDEAAARRREVITSSRARVARAWTEVEAELLRQFESASADQPPERRKITEPAKPVPTEPPPPPAMEPSPLPPEPVAITLPPPKPIGEGVGGPAHRIVVQQLVQEAAAMGFWTDREFTLSGGGRVDLVIGNSRRKIAVEVAMTGNTAHEIENLTKCLAAGFTAVVCVSPHPGIVANIRAAAQRQQMPEFARLHFLSPDELITQLKAFAAENEEPAGPDVKVIGGRRITVRRMEHSEAQRKSEEEGFRTVGEFLSLKSPPGGS